MGTKRTTRDPTFPLSNWFYKRDKFTTKANFVAIDHYLYLFPSIMSSIYPASSQEAHTTRILDRVSNPSQPRDTDPGTRSYSDVAKATDFSPLFSILSRFSYLEPPDLPLDDGRAPKPLVQYQTYPHPSFVENWEEIWATPPIILYPLRPHQPVAEDKFLSVRGRLYLFAENILDIYEQIPIKQGTTLVERQSSTLHARFIVERCQWVHNHKAYLKVVGITQHKKTLPYNHPVFPSFILVIPVCVSNVPIPDEIAPFIRPEEYESLYQDLDGRMTLCRICTR